MVALVKADILGADDDGTYAALVAPSPDLAEDIAQEVFIESIKSLPRFDPSRDFGTWLRGIGTRFTVAAEPQRTLVTVTEGRGLPSSVPRSTRFA